MLGSSASIVQFLMLFDITITVAHLGVDHRKRVWLVQEQTQELNVGLLGSHVEGSAPAFAVLKESKKREDPVKDRIYFFFFNYNVALKWLHLPLCHKRHP